MKAIHWRIPFTNADNENMCINIYADGTPSEVKTLTGGAIWNGGIMETQEAYSDNPFDTLRFQTGTIHIANADGNLSMYDIMPTKATDRPVQLVRERDSKVLWQGFLSCEGYTQQYVSRTQIVDFNIKSVLKALEDQPIADEFRELHSDLSMSIGEMIRLAVEYELQRNECPFGITSWNYPNEYRYFQDYMVELGLFYEDKEDIAADGSAIKKLGGKTYGYMIDTVCQYGCVAMREAGTAVYLQPISKNGAIGGVSQIQMQMSALEARGTEQTIKTEYPYKALTVDVQPKNGDTGETNLPDDNDITFGVDGNYSAHDKYSSVYLSWDRLEGNDLRIDSRIWGYKTNEKAELEVDARKVASDFASAHGGTSGQYRYAIARLGKYSVKERWGGNYDYTYGLAIIPYYDYLIERSIYPDVIASFYQKNYTPYDNVLINGLVPDKWSMINIQAKISYFYRDGELIEKLGDDERWLLNCYFYIEDQFGVKQYLVGQSNQNPTWSTTKGIFSLYMIGDKVEDNYDKNKYWFNQVEGFLVAFENQRGSRHIKCTLDIVSSASRIEDTGAYLVKGFNSLFLTEMKIAPVKNPNNMLGSTKLGRKMHQELGGVEDNKEVTLNICTSYAGGNNMHSSLLYHRLGSSTDSIQPAESVAYTRQDGTVEDLRPERVVFDRMVAQWSKPRRQVDLQVKTIETPLPLTRFAGYDGKTYLPLCEKRNWGTCTSTITFFEVEG